MKTLVVLILLAISGGVYAQDVTFSKKELVEMIEPAMLEHACTENIITCLGITKKRCESEVHNLVKVACDKHIPENGAGMETIKEISKNTASCVMSDIFAKHKAAMQKNIKSPACQALTH